MKKSKYYKEKGTEYFYKKELNLFVEKVKFQNDYIEFKSSKNLFEEKAEPKENDLLEVSENDYYDVLLKVKKIINSEKK